MSMSRVIASGSKACASLSPASPSSADSPLNPFSRAISSRIFGLHITAGQEEGEGAAATWGALHPDLASQEPRDFSADGQTQPGPPELPARRTVCLLERLEDELLLFLGDTDPGVLHHERNHR